MDQIYTYRDGRIRSPWLKAFNHAGAALERVGLRASLDPDAVVAAAAREAGSSDLGGESYREPLEQYVAALEEEASVSTLGRLAIGKILVAQLAHRIRLHAWTQAHPEAAEEKIRQPWVIVGLPRTGTTLLSMLLALDPNAPLAGVLNPQIMSTYPYLTTIAVLSYAVIRTESVRLAVPSALLQSYNREMD